MAITATDIKIRYSTTSGSAGNTTAGTAGGSLGKYMSTTDASASANGVFDDVSGAESTSGDTEYRCLFIYNSHGSLAYQNASVSLTDDGTGATITIGADTTAASTAGSASAQALTIANEDTAPAGVSFGAGPVSLGTLNSGNCKAIWIKRVVSAGTSAVAGDSFTLTINGDTAP